MNILERAQRIQALREGLTKETEELIRELAPDMLLPSLDAQKLLAYDAIDPQAMMDWAENTFRGGHVDPDKIRVFRHGMQTAFNVISERLSKIRTSTLEDFSDYKGSVPRD